MADIVSRYKWHFRLFKNRTLSVAAIVAFLFGTALEADHLGRNVEPTGVSGFATLVRLYEYVAVRILDLQLRTIELEPPVLWGLSGCRDSRHVPCHTHADLLIQIERSVESSHEDRVPLP